MDRRPLSAAPRDEDWLEIMARAAAGIREATLPLIGTAEGRVVVGEGAGGDQTVELDRRAEEVAVARLRAEPAGRLSVLSEEAGLVDLGAAWPRLLIDPVDGSLNAKRGVPVAATMLALARGPKVGDVTAALVMNLVTGECWSATAGGGLFAGGTRIRPREGGSGRLGVLAVEGAPRHVLELGGLIAGAAKVRVLGSMAISMVLAATGAVDAVASAMSGRVFDLTAGVLMVKEAGGVVSDLAGNSLDGLDADLTARSTLLASADPATHRLALSTWRGGGA